MSVRNIGSATPEETHAAVVDIMGSEADLRRLTSVAQKRIAALGRYARGRNHKDLLHEVFTSTLSGGRAWKKQVPFIAHLFETMKGIVWNWREKEKRKEKHAKEVNSTGTSLVEELKVEDEKPSPEATYSGRERLALLREHFHEDVIVLNVIEGQMAGFSGPEICEYYNLADKVFHAARKRILRNSPKELYDA